MQLRKLSDCVLLQGRHAGLTSLPYAQMITGPTCSATRGGTPPPGGGKSMWLLLALCLWGSGLPCVPLLGFWAGLPWSPLRGAGGPSCGSGHIPCDLSGSRHIPSCWPCLACGAYGRSLKEVVFGRSLKEVHQSVLENSKQLATTSFRVQMRAMLVKA